MSVGTQLYNAICKAEHGPHVLACQPGIGGHKTGLVLACTAGYHIKHARGNPACRKHLRTRVLSQPRQGDIRINKHAS